MRLIGSGAIWVHGCSNAIQWGPSYSYSWKPDGTLDLTEHHKGKNPRVHRIPKIIAERLRGLSKIENRTGLSGDNLIARFGELSAKIETLEAVARLYMPKSQT